MKTSKTEEVSLCLTYKPIFCVFLALILQHLRATTALGNETDHNALLAIKSRLVDHSQGVLSQWNQSLNYCQWEGVTCDRKHNRVITLKLSSKGLAGTLSPFIGNLSFLKTISFENNFLQGEIPPELGRLSRLQELNLNNNSLIGELPKNLSSCRDLQILSIKSNKLEGKLPTELGVLSNLRNFSIAMNNFHGPLFQAIANLTSLEWILAGFNAFTGTIDGVLLMPNISVIGVPQNKLTGQVPNSIFNLSFLQVLDLGENQFQGEIPANIGFTVPQLYYLTLGANQFSGSIPNSIENLTSLEFLDLSENNFTGRIHHNFGLLKSLKFLNLALNYRLQGDINLIISSLVNCSQLKVLGLHANDIKGILPNSIANLSTTLTWLSLSNNPITGTFPASITNFINLVTLYMDNINLRGSLPYDFGKLQKLETALLRSNELTGKIPNSVGNLSHLTTLYLQNNKLEGNIPPSIGNCQYLQILYLQNNNLSGALPTELFGESLKLLLLDVSQNQLEGSLPLAISKQINLNEFRVSNNKLSGVIPYGLGDCVDLQALFMDGNSFHGNIPPSLSSLVSLQQLDLSRNNLSGTIPVYLSRFSSIYYLNLSYNHFEGKVPTNGVFANASAVNFVGNTKLCGGISALHFPKCIDGSIKTRRKTSQVIKIIVPVVCTLAVVLVLVIALYPSYVRNKGKPTLSSLVIRKQPLNVSYTMLLKATHGFSSETLLGVGTFGSVFKGNLEGRTVAVKVLNLQHQGASKSFLAECKALRNARHRNLVGIITACSSIDYQANEFKALIYEFMPNGSLDSWLHGARNLTLSQRLDIAIDVAQAIKYLHHDHGSPIVHCDLKPSNVLIDNNMVARVGDFGLAKFLAQSEHQNQSSTIGIRGTVGYAAPEYGLGSEVCPDGDLYSYGVLLLELMTGKRPTNNMFKEDYTLHMYAKTGLPDKVLQIADPSLEENEIHDEVDDKRAIKATIQRRMECMVSMVSVGVACSHHIPQDRMRIPDAISKLQAARDTLVNAELRTQ